MKNKIKIDLNFRKLRPMATPNKKANQIHLPEAKIHNLYNSYGNLIEEFKNTKVNFI